MEQSNALKRTSHQPVFFRGRAIGGYRPRTVDVTQRKRTEEALRESERSLRSAIDGIAGLVAILAPNGELEAVNRQILEYFGRVAGRAEELGNKRCGTS